MITKRLLFDMGYLRSVRGKRIVDEKGNPLPWYTFPAIAYLDSLELGRPRVLEFGSGNSTLYWQRRAHSLVSVEHDPTWYDTFRSEVGPNTTYVLATDVATYLAPVDEAARFDVIVVDGEHRRRCGEVALRQRSAGGIIVLDNSEWFPDIAQSFRSAGLVGIDFAGFGAVQAHTWVTSVFIDPSHPPMQLHDAPHVPMGGTGFSHAMRDHVGAHPAF